MNIIASDSDRYFVDRTQELDTLKSFIDQSDSKRIFFLHGKAGFGKSALLKRFINESAREKHAYAYYDFRSTDLRPQSLTLLRVIADAIDSEHLTDFRQKIDNTIKSLASLPTIDPTVNSVLRVEPRAFGLRNALPTPIDGQRRSQYRIAREDLTWDFLRRINELQITSISAVCILDSYEATCAAVKDWLWDDLLSEISLMHEARVKFVIASRDSFSSENIPLGMENFVRAIELGPIDDLHCREYLIERLGLPIPEAELVDILKQVEGNPLFLSLKGLELRSLHIDG